MLAGCSNYGPVTVIPQAPTIAEQQKASAKKLMEIKTSLDQYQGTASELSNVKSKIENLIAADPQNAPVYTQLARYLLLRGKTSKGRYQPGTLNAAEKALQKTLKIDPEHTEAYVIYSQVYVQKKQYTKAKSSLDQAEKLGRQSPELHLAFARIHSSQGNHKQAAKRFEQILKSKTKDKTLRSLALNQLIRHHSRLGSTKKVGQLYEKLVKLENQNFRVYPDYALHLLYAEGDYNKAIKYAQKAYDLLDSDKNRYILAAALYRKWAQLYTKSRHKQAKKIFQRAQKIYPDTGKIAKDAARSPHTSLTVKAFRSRDLEAMSRALRGQ